jgi:ATP-dependent helicase/nuclease subunit A
MPRRFKPLPVLEGDQRRASDPQAHAALSASAGTGKTQVLTARVLRLLLGGVDPGAILCLTFTKAGAAEMANRIAERLAAWVRMPDAALRHDLFALGEEDRSPPALQRARRLFARVLETPGGLRIQTIHGFAQTLLASFPAEAGISPGFQPIEGRAEAELIRRTLATLLADAEASGNEALIADVQALSLRLGEGGAQEYLTTCARAEEMIDALGDPARFETALLEAIGIAEASATDAIAARLADDEIDVPTIEELIEANRAWGSATGATIVANLTAFLAATPLERIGMLDNVGKKLVTAKGDPCKATSGQLKVHPDYTDLLSEFAHWLVGLRNLRAAADFAVTQAAGLRAGQAFARAYRLAKRAAGVADFDDLIAWTRKLLSIEGMGDWVRFKLDQRTDHILVDEAQDTNADQWAIVDALASEYFSGQSEAELRWRTLFMVGDYKQAIFGFQGTDPKQFDAFRQLVADRAAAAGEAALDSESFAREFRDLSIDASFRSSPAILQVVDALIDEVGHGAMGLTRRPNRHDAAHADRPGEVLWWPPFAPSEGEEGEEGEEGWVAEPVRLYADALARQIKAWLDEAAPLATTERALCAGDILVLVRSRTELASLLVARLYAHGVPVAGIDRLHLSKPLAVKDLLSAIGFAVQPHDDLNLAGLLVSPIIGLDQQQLLDLSYDRPGSLWQVLQARRGESAFNPAFVILADLLKSADYVTPARFLENLLSGPTDTRRKLLERLGEAARDPIEELVASALEFEAQEGASLDRFLAWFSRGDVEVKRDPSSAGNAVRVMTVHGAKGLEAPLVILADATHDPSRVGRRPQSLDLPLGEPRHAVPLLRPRAEELVSPYRELIEAQRESDLQEHWRLLYVGLTRAAERLIITGVRPSRGEVVEDSWHSRTATAMMALGGNAHVGPWGEGLSWQGITPPRALRLRARRRPHEPIALPGWARTQAPEEERPPRPLSPSSIGPDRDALPPPSPEMRAAAERGTMLHSLFERLPAVAATDRRAAALAWLARAGVTDQARALEMVESALAVIDDPRFADLFAADALAEAPIAATLPDGRVIAGTVDRLCIGEDLIRVIDFKTGRSVPPSVEALPHGHVAQMRAYADALAVIFPGRRIEAALLYTHGPALIALPA